jgi:hypothetical protein
LYVSARGTCVVVKALREKEKEKNKKEERGGLLGRPVISLPLKRQKDFVQ